MGNRPAQDVFRPSREATRPDRGTRSGMATGVVPDPPTARKDLCRTRVVLPLIVRSGMTIALPHQPTTPACTNTLRRACSATYSCRSRSRVSSTTSVSFVRTARIASAYRMLNRRTLEPTLVPLAISKYRRPTRPPRAGFTCGGSTPAMRSMISGLLALIPMRNPFDTNAVSAAHPRRSIFSIHVEPGTNTSSSKSRTGGRDPTSCVIGDWSLKGPSAVESCGKNAYSKIRPQAKNREIYRPPTPQSIFAPTPRSR